MDVDVGRSVASEEDAAVEGYQPESAELQRDRRAKFVLGPVGFVWALITAATTKNLSHVAAGVAFYMLLSLFPAIAVVLSLLSLFSDATQVDGYLEALKTLLPVGAYQLIEIQVRNTVAAGGLKLGSTAAISFAIAFWSSSAAVRALMTAMHMSFEAARGLNVFGYYVLSLLFTLLGMAMVGAAVGLLVALPLVFETLRALTENEITLDASVIDTMELPIMILLSSLALTAIYRLGSARGPHAMRAAFLGAATATLIWIAASRLLAYYFATVGDLATTYGPIGAVAGLMLWFWISAFILLLGAEFANIASGGRPSERTEMS